MIARRPRRAARHLAAPVPLRHRGADSKDDERTEQGLERSGPGRADRGRRQPLQPELRARLVVLRLQRVDLPGRRHRAATSATPTLIRPRRPGRSSRRTARSPCCWHALHKGGVADDGATELTDTFPRVAPFESELADGKVYWVTVVVDAPRRSVQRATTNSCCGCSRSIRPRSATGKDGSMPGFYLPFQDLGTANHIAQWTEQIVTDDPPRQPPKPPTPPSPPPPPPPPDVPD